MIEIKDVSFNYAGSGTEDRNLDKINLSIKKGECVLLCGQSGCGKTTITRLLNGLIPKYYPGQISGEVTIDEIDADKMMMFEISEKVGSVFQNPKTQFFNVDVNSEISFGLENQAVPPKEIRERMNRVIKELKITKLDGRSIFELSGGEKQKIAFASVYAMNPDIYSLDEPSSNLDMETMQELKRYLLMIKRQGKTIIIAEHRIHYLMDIADRIIYLQDGKIQAEMTPDELRQLSIKKRMEMGLRAVDLAEVHPVLNQIKSEDNLQLEIRDMELMHKKAVILQKISFTAKSGEVIAVTGKNGSGKTTFLRAVCGLHRDCSGTVLLNQKAQNRSSRQKASYLVMQDVNYQLFADSVKAECTLGIRETDEELVNHTLDQLGLYAFKEKHPNTLSGGQKQRVAVAVSMVCKKKLLAFDEPTSGLDLNSMKQVVELIRTLSRDKIIFVVTHDYEFICQSCTRIIHFGSNGLDVDLPVISQHEEKIKQAIGIIK